MRAAMLTDTLRPYRPISLPASVVYALGTAAVVVLAWQGARVIPGPRDVLAALAELWQDHGLFDELVASMTLNVEALAWSSAIALALAYLTVVPAVRPLAAMLSKLRFTGLVGWSFVFTVYAADGHQLKLWMLVFGTAPFILTAMAAIVADIPRERLDHARVIYPSEWRVVYEVAIRGTADQALEAIRQSAAMGWMMLTMVEGVVHSKGGIGVMMLDEHKHLKLDAVFALILVVLAVGIVQDFALAWLRRTLCPYARPS
ncbi:MAG: ABC transporter permease subunit [Kofleriaceae bacterium]